MKHHTTTQTGFAKIWLIIVLAILLIGGGGYAYYALQESDDEETTASETAEEQPPEGDTETPEQASEPDGFTLFSDTATDIRFYYPDDWGTATMTQDDFSHDGESYYFSFSENDEVRAGVKSLDFVYTDGPRGGFGAIGLGGQLFSEHVANIEEANEGEWTEIIRNGDAHLLYAGVDMGSGSFLSLALDINTRVFSYVEFAYTGNELPPDGSDGIATHLDIDRIAELEAMANTHEIYY